MSQKTVTIAGQDYTLAPVTAGEAKSFKAEMESHDFNMAMVAASLRAGGSQVSNDDVANMPYFGVYLPLQKACMEVNGLIAEGEAPAAPATDAAASISDPSIPQ